MKKIFIILLISVLISCKTKPECTTKAKFETGEEVEMRASRFKKKAIIIDVIRNEDCTYSYKVSYFKLWDTRRLKIVSELEIQ